MTEEQKAALEKTLGMIAQQLENLSLRVNILELMVSVTHAPTPTVLYDGIGEFTRTPDGVTEVLLFDGHFKKMMAPSCRVHVVITEDIP